MISIQTSRLKIYPASEDQMKKFISAETDAELKKAYSEMLDGCLKDPDLWEWYAMWMIELDDNTHIGDLCFKGLNNKDGTTEIGYGLLPEFRGYGYATEAVKAVLEWAFSHPLINAVEAEADENNIASQRVLEKCGFKPTGETGEEGPRYILTR